MYVTSTLRTTPTNSETAIKWSNELISTTATSLTDGEGNTAILAALNPGEYSAADACAGEDFGGHDDWYLPARNQLTTLYTYRVAIGGFSGGTGYYWASTDRGGS